MYPEIEIISLQRHGSETIMLKDYKILEDRDGVSKEEDPGSSPGSMSRSDAGGHGERSGGSG